MTEAFSILLIDDDDTDRRLAASVLRQRFPKARIAEVSNALTFAQHFAAGDFAVAVSDIGLEWADGQDLLSAIRHEYPDCVTVGLARAGAQTTPSFDRNEADTLDDYLDKSAAGFVELPRQISRQLALAEDVRRDAVADAAYQRYVQELPVGVFSLDRNGMVTVVNKQLLEALGHADERTLVGQPFVTLLAESEERDHCLNQLEKGASCPGIFAEALTADGQSVTVSLSFWVVPDVNWAPACFTGVLWPASAERCEPQKTDFLELRDERPVAPTRAPATASAPDSASDEPGTAVDEATALAAQLQAAANKMHSMVGDLADAPTVTETYLATAPVDLDAAVSAARDSLHNATAEFTARIEWKQLPIIVAEPREIAELLYGLLSIAAHLPGPRPIHVDVDVEDQREHWVIRVHRLRVQSAATIDETMGSTLPSDAVALLGADSGLALCRRIAERHAGTVWTRAEASGITLFASIAKRINQRPDPGELTVHD